MDIWKEIPDFPNYKVSNTGKVMNVKTRRILSSTPTQAGRWRYHQVTLYNDLETKVYAVHRLVAQAFIPNPYNFKYVTFKDKDIHNLKSDNLMWVQSNV